MIATNIIIVDPNAAVMSIRVLRAIADNYKKAELHRQPADKLKDARDHKLLCNVLVDAIWESLGTDNSKIYLCKRLRCLN